MIRRYHFSKVWTQAGVTLEMYLCVIILFYINTWLIDYSSIIGSLLELILQSADVFIGR